MTDARRTVVVAGDVTVDWMLLSTEGVARTIELSKGMGRRFRLPGRVAGGRSLSAGASRSRDDRGRRGATRTGRSGRAGATG